MISDVFQRVLAAFLTLLVASLAVSRLALAHIAGDGSGRATYDFNPGWRLLGGDPSGADRADFDDTSWKPVALPRAWNEDAAFKVSIEQLPTGIAWYRKRFTLPPEDAGKTVYLEFEGVRHTADVYFKR